MNGGVEYRLKLDNTGFVGPLNQARSGLSGFAGFANPQMLALGAAAAVAAAGYKLIKASIEGVRASMSEAADRETMETAFIPILGSARAARERMAELADFAAHTPFQLPGIAAASKILESLTNGALSTGNGLRLVGDAASACNVPIDEMAVTIGRLYSGLEGGRPAGEAMMRLQELGAISPAVRSRLEDLQTAGKKGADVWQVAAAELSKYSGGMELQSKTWHGKISTLGDAWAEVRAQFGKPINDALKPLLDDNINLVGKLASTAKTIGDAIGYGLRFGIEAWKQGEVASLIGNSLKLGFGEGVNSLWKGTQGWLAMLAPTLIEAFKSGVLVLDILTDVSFWQGVGVALLSVLQAAVAAMLGGLSQSLASIMSTIPGMDKYREFMSGLADEFYKAQRGYMSTSGQSSAGLVDQYGGRIEGQYLDSLNTISAAFAQGYNNTPDVWDTTDYRESIKSASDRIVAALAAQDKAKAAEEGKAVTRKKASQDEPNKPFKVMWETVFAGSLAKVGGGGYGRLMLSAENIPAKQLTEQKKTNELLNKILQKEGGAAIFA